MSFQPLLIGSFNSGLIKSKKPYALIDDSFQMLQNTYTWRERVKRREGIKLVGRLRRQFTVAVKLTNQANGATYVVTDILADAAFGLRTSEPDAQIEPGGVTIVVGALSFSDSTTATPPGAENGVLVEAGSSTGTINYTTGRLDLAFSPSLGGATDVDVTFSYYPALPAMGIRKREQAAINNEQTAWFDTKYVYSYDGNDFSSPSSSVWSGNDSDFFWMANFRGITADVRLFFATNNATPSLSTNNRIRHTADLATWTDFTPAVSGTDQTGIAPTTLAVGSVAYAGTLSSTPIIPGSVTITVENGVDDTVGFRDQVGTYPAGTLNGSPSTNSGIIDYSTGVVTLSFSSAFTVSTATVTAIYQNETSSMFQAKIIVPYYGRLLALNVFEGLNAGASLNIFNRCRFAQVGDPLQQDAWISTIPGKGGFIDAPTNEAIVSAQFYKNTLIVSFDHSTWQLTYVGNYGLPFLWERISTDFGAESTFSTVLFDGGILAVGDKAIVKSSGNDVQRIDLDIPDTVFEFNNEDGGKKRVHGTRDFKKELVYWTYSDGGLAKKFPNRTLVYNYRNNTYATFRDNVTVFGELTTPTGDLWDLPISWDSNISWDESFPAQLPAKISGNQQGWIHWYQYPDAETTADSLTNMNEHESLAIKSITLSAASNISVEISNHNLEQNEIIFITGLLFVDESTDTTVSTDLNNRFFQVTITDDDNVTLTEWNFTTQQYQETTHNAIAYTPDPADGDTYMGGGQMALVQNMEIITKDFNPFVGQGSHIKMSYTDFMMDATPNSAISVDLFINSSFNTRGNLIVGNKQVETAIDQFGRVSNITRDDPAQLTSENHGLQSGAMITIRDVLGMTQVNGGLFTITYVDDDNFTLGVDSSGFTDYASGGEWLTQENRFYVPGSRYAWHRFYASCYGQYLSYRLFYDDNLMNTIDTHQTGFELNAIMLYLKKGGRLVL